MPYGVLSTRRVATWIALLLAVVLFVSATTGFLAEGWRHWDHFNGEVAAIVGTALGTTALAGFTGALAFTTSGDVRATWELADLTRSQQAAQERPIVIASNAEFSGSADAGRVSFDLVNVGLGPALRVRLLLEHEHTPDMQWQYELPALRGGESYDGSVSVQVTPRPGGIGGGEFRVASGTYLDRSRKNEYEVITDWGQDEKL
jgi:hypothetical protein